MRSINIRKVYRARRSDVLTSHQEMTQLPFPVLWSCASSSGTSFSLVVDPEDNEDANRAKKFIASKIQEDYKRVGIVKEVCIARLDSPDAL